MSINTINNINGINTYTPVLLNLNNNQTYLGQYQDSLFGNNILSLNANSFDTAMLGGLTGSTQSNSNSLLEMLLPLLLQLLTGQQNTQTSSINNNAVVQSTATVDNSNVNTLENLSLSDKKGASKTIANVLANDISTGKKVINYNYKDEVYSIAFYDEDGKHTKTLQADKDKCTTEFIYDDEASNLTGRNEYDVNDKLSAAYKNEFNDKGQATSLSSSLYDANEKLNKTSVYTKTENQTTRVTKSYDEEGNVTNTYLNQNYFDGNIIKSITTNTDKDGNVISKNTVDRDKNGSIIPETSKSYDKDGNIIPDKMTLEEINATSTAADAANAAIE